MTTELEAMRQSGQRLRADLMAANLTIGAIASVLTTEQQAQLMKAMAELSVMTEQTAEKAQMPEHIAALQSALERQYQAVQGSIRMRQAKQQSGQS